MRRQPAARAATSFVGLCAALSFVVYARAFDNPFRQDDFIFLQYVETHAITDVLAPGSEFAFYRPGSVALFELEHAWFGQRSGHYIAFNYFLHACIAVLMFLTLRRLCGRDAAAIASALFLVGFGHYGKQVMWACTGGPVLSVALSTASILLLLGGTERPKKESHLRPLMAIGMLALAVLFHEAAASMTAVAAIIVATDGTPSPRWERAAPFLVLFAAALVLWLARTQYAGYHAIGIKEATLNAPVHLVSYLGFMLLPLQPTAMIDAGSMTYAITHIAPVARVLIGVAMLVVLALTALRRRDEIRLLALWLVVALLPFTVLRQPPDRLELRYLYPASIPFCALAAVVVIGLWNRNRRAARLLALGIVLAAVAGSVALQLVLERHYDQWR